MRVYVSVDMEGATGVTHQDDVTEGAAGYESGRVLVSGDADAAVREVLAPRTLGLAWHADRHRSRSSEAFAALAVSVCDELERSFGSD